MKKLLVATAIVLPLVLSACGGTRTIVVESTTPEQTAPPATAPQTKGGVDGYFNAVMEAFPDAVNIHGRKWIVEFGTVACDAIDEGMSLSDLAGMVPQGGDVELIGYMVRQAVLNICPHNQWFLDAAAKA